MTNRIALVLLACAVLLAGCAPAAAPSSTATPTASDFDAAEPIQQGETGTAASAAPQGQGDADTALPDRADGAVRILFLNVGKADAALVFTADRAYLIDSGEKDTAWQLLSALAWAGIGKLDGVFLTHTHSDHIGGAKELIKVFETAAVYRASVSENKEKGGNKIDDLAADAGVPVTLLSAGDVLTLGQGLTAEVLGPVSGQAADDNDNSLVLMLHAFDTRILMTGDMQFAEEQALLALGADVACDILKIGNHGNPDATGDDFGAASSPAAAVVSTDTSVDTDSDNPRVRAALPGAAVYSTEGTDLGVLLTVRADGGWAFSFPRRAKPATASVTLASASRAGQSVELRNTGAAAVSLAGYILMSENGADVFVFPADAALAPGETVLVTAAGGGGAYAFPGKSIFSKKKEDAAILYDPSGNLLARLAVSQ